MGYAEETPGQFATWLEATAQALGYTSDSALAKALSVEQSTVSRWKTSATARPSIDQLLKIGKLFGIRLEPLLVLSGHAPADAVGVSELPAQPTSAAERQIVDADPEVQELLRQYWGARMREEEIRLAWLMVHVSEVQAAQKVPAGKRQSAIELVSTNVQTHVSDVLTRAFEAYAAPKRFSITDEHLAKVVAVYQAAAAEGRAPGTAVANHFHTTISAATRWVTLARRAQMLPPKLPPVSREP